MSTLKIPEGRTCRSTGPGVKRASEMSGGGTAMWVEVLDPCEGQARRSVGSCSPKCRLLASECPLPGVGWKD